jgi:GAF domain-containing protein
MACLQHRLNKERPPTAADPPAILTMAHYESLAEALTAERRDEWLVAMRALGGGVADRHAPVEELIADAVSFCRRLRECVTEDMPGGWPDEPQLAHDLEKLETDLLTALLAGYVAARERDLAEQKEKLDIANALHEVNSAANSTLNLDAVLNKTVQAVVDIGAADVCSLFTYEPEIDRLVLRATCGLSPGAVGQVSLRLGQGVTGTAAALGKPVAVRVARDDPRFLSLPLLGEDDCRSILAVPIVLFTVERKLVGVITLESRVERDFGQREINFLETVAGEIAIAIENARLFRQTDSRLRQKVAELEMLQGFSATVAETLDLRKVLKLLASNAARLIEADAVVVYELHNKRMEPVAVYNFTVDPEVIVTAPSRATPLAGRHPAIEMPAIALRDSALSRTILRGQPVGLHRVQTGADSPGTWVSDDGASGHEAIEADPAISDLPYQSIFCVPLSAPRGIVGAICLYNREARTFNPEQIALLNAFAREGGIAVENARLYEGALHGLEVKTWLMREMNHRVRNNLARAVSLLQMQQRRLSEDSPAAKALTDSIVRMESVARVHDLLSHEELGLTSVADLLQLASEVVTNTLGRPDLRVHWQIDAAPIPITSSTAFPLLLALVELLSNAVLHGFTGREEGAIEITATRPEDAVQIVIRDNGAGLPAGFGVQKDADLGLMIVQLLIQSELKGTIHLEPAPECGVLATITFTPPVAADE